MILLIMGKRGSGKSYLVKRLLSRLENAIVLDVFNEYTTLPIAKHPSDFDILKKCRVKALSNEIEDLFFDTVERLENRVIVFEEIDRYCSPSWIDDRLDRMVRYGRHANLSIIGVTRRPAEIHRNITANANQIISFKMVEPRDIAYFKQISGIFANQIQGLGRYEYAVLTI